MVPGGAHSSQNFQQGPDAFEVLIVCHSSDLLHFPHSDSTLVTRSLVIFQVLLFGPMSPACHNLQLNGLGFQDHQNVDS